VYAFACVPEKGNLFCLDSVHVSEISIEQFFSCLLVDLISKTNPFHSFIYPTTNYMTINYTCITGEILKLKITQQYFYAKFGCKF